VTAAPPPPPDPLWTLEEASTWFAQGGVPISPARLRLIIRGLREPGNIWWKPAGRAPSGPGGGVGQAKYPVRDLMLLHSSLSRWLPGGQIAG
jgi:hypothetical protein